MGWKLGEEGGVERDLAKKTGGGNIGNNAGAEGGSSLLMFKMSGSESRKTFMGIKKITLEGQRF